MTTVASSATLCQRVLHSNERYVCSACLFHSIFSQSAPHRILRDKLADDPDIHGAMLTLIILGADKTTVSVATGHQEDHRTSTTRRNELSAMPSSRSRS